MANKRIRDLSERTTFSSGDYLATDNSSGTRKVDASKILTPISTAQSTADLVQSEVATSNDEFSKNKGYNVGDLVVAPDDKLIYRCKTAYSTGASWASRKANFEHVTMLEAVDSLNAALNPIGTIIHSTTCDTMAKVVATYGGTTWIQHSGYVLKGASSGVVANSATKTGGDDTKSISTTHLPTDVAVVPNSAMTTQGAAMNSTVNTYKALAIRDASGISPKHQDFDVQQSYKSVYIWERIA